MRKVAIGFVFGALAAAVIWMQAPTSAGEKKSDNLAHMVYFKLKDNSPKAVKALVDSCNKHLSGHDGTVYFSAGTLAQDLKRDVNDRDFDVALHLVFKDSASHDKYQVHPRHDEFIKEGKDNWAKVRVFDAYVSAK
jgi:hypothetical protein